MCACPVILNKILSTKCLNTLLPVTEKKLCIQNHDFLLILIIVHNSMTIFYLNFFGDKHFFKHFFMTKILDVSL